MFNEKAVIKVILFHTQTAVTATDDSNFEITKHMIKVILLHTQTAVTATDDTNFEITKHMIKVIKVLGIKITLFNQYVQKTEKDRERSLTESTETKRRDTEKIIKTLCVLCTLNLLCEKFVPLQTALQ